MLVSVFSCFQRLLSLWFVSGRVHLVHVTLSVHSCYLEPLYGTFKKCLPHIFQQTPWPSSFNQTPAEFITLKTFVLWWCCWFCAASLIFTVWGTRSDDQTVNVNKHHFPSHPYLIMCSGRVAHLAVYKWDAVFAAQQIRQTKLSAFTNSKTGP